MKVTSKGQVTIPREIRQKLGIDENSEVDFIEKDGLVILTKNKKSNHSISKIRSLKGVASIKLTTEQILSLTR